MHKKLYFYFQETNYFGHTPHHKFMMVENNQDYARLVLNDPDCIIFNTGGDFYAIVTTSTFKPPTETITSVDMFVNFPGVCLIAKCFNYNVEQYYRSVDFTDEKIYGQLIALIRTVIS